MKGLTIALIGTAALISGCAVPLHYPSTTVEQRIVYPPPVVVYNYPCETFPTVRARMECRRSYDRQLDHEARRVGRESARRGY